MWNAPEDGEISINCILYQVLYDTTTQASETELSQRS